jgi:phosphoserine phosphatase
MSVSEGTSPQSPGAPCAGEIEFEPALRTRVALLIGLPAGVIDEIIAARIRLTPGARTLVTTMRANGAYACLVTGGFTLFTKRIAAIVGFDEHRANSLLVDAAIRLTGDVEESRSSAVTASLQP